MTSIIPTGHILIHDAVEDEGRQLFPDTWTGEEGRERSRVLEIMAMPLGEQAWVEGQPMRLLTSYASLCKKLEGGQLKAVVVDEATGIMTPADPAIFRSERVWKYLGIGIAPIDPHNPDRLGALYVAQDVPEQPKNRGGRPPLYDWEEFLREVIRRVEADPDGLPETQAKLEQEMAEWCSKTWGTEPGESTIREKVTAIYLHCRGGQKPR